MLPLTYSFRKTDQDLTQTDNSEEESDGLPTEEKHFKPPVEENELDGDAKWPKVAWLMSFPNR